jgi:hypothetical protein
MERNDNLGNLGDATGAGQGGTTGGGGMAGGTGGYGGTSGFGGSDVGGASGGFGATGAGGAGGGMGGGATGGFGGGSTGGDVSGTGSVADRARDAAGQAQEKLSDVGSTVRERAGNVKNSLADALEAGADRLRSRGGGSQQLAGATGYGDQPTTTDGGGRVAEIGDRVAGGLQTSADWLREADIDGLRQGVERQVRDNPGRTLLIAIGLGYLLGKAFRR